MPDIKIILDKIKETDKGEKIIIAVDGRAASGKTTLANALKDAVGASVVHTDHFFLPLNLRTKERLDTAGGNFHYERFKTEVLPYIRKNKDFSYRTFSCKKMDFDAFAYVKNSHILIVEGAYSCHNVLGKYYDFSVFLDVDKKEQINRIVLRNGKDKAKIFAERWIVMEEKYFSAQKTAENADIVMK